MKQYLQNSISRYAPVHALIGAALILLFLVSALVFSPNVAPEFSGTAELRVTFDTPQTVSVVDDALQAFTVPVITEPLTETVYTITARALSDREYQTLLTHITESVGSYTVQAYQSFSPTISKELVRKAIIAILAAAVIIVIYIAFVFKKVSRPIASWKYGIIAIIALLHDSIAPLGVFALLSLFTDAAVDALFITALLATLGYSINDTIVIFDRIRDRLQNNADKKRKEEFALVVDRGVRDSIRRSVYTSVSTMIPLILLMLLVPIMQWFSVALLVGVLAGTYSSLFFAPSLLVLWNTYFPQNHTVKKKKTDTQQAEDALQDVLRNQDTI